MRLPRPSASKLRAPSLQLPHLRFPGLSASIVVGALIGLIVAGLGALTLNGCASLRGTTSCGGSGLPLLIVIMAAGVVLGSIALRATTGMANATTISFLGVAIVGVVGGLFFLEWLDGPAAAGLLPLLGAIGFAASYWLTVNVIDGPEA